MITTDDQLFSLLQQQFGFREFRRGQLEAIQALFQNHRLLCIQPTGHGKSLLYQLPACLLKGIPWSSLRCSLSCAIKSNT